MDEQILDHIAKSSGLARDWDQLKRFSNHDSAWINTVCKTFKPLSVAEIKQRMAVVQADVTIIKFTYDYDTQTFTPHSDASQDLIRMPFFVLRKVFQADSVEIFDDVQRGIKEFKQATLNNIMVGDSSDCKFKMDNFFIRSIPSLQTFTKCAVVQVKDTILIIFLR
jgi:hypothetical protein